MSWRQLWDYDGDTGTPNSDRVESGDPDVIDAGEVIVVPARSDRRGGSTGSEDNVFVAPDPGEGGGSNLMVRVKEVTNDAPIRDVNVTIAGPTRLEGTTDVNGEFQAEGVDPGSYSITASRNGFTARNQPVEIEIGAATSNVADVQLAAQSKIEIVEDDSGSFSVDENSATVDFVRFGIWDNAFDGSGALKNQQDEQNNFVGADTRRFYFRVEDPMVTDDTLNISWKTLRSNRRDDDVPADLTLTLEETSDGSHIFVSKAVMLVTDNTDRNCSTHSGYPPPLAISGNRNRGQSNHRIRKGKINGYVKGEYTPASGGVTLSVEKPIFKRTPDDERRQVEIRVVNYGGNATQGYINGQIAHANDRWNQVGLKITTGASSTRPVPAAAQDGAGRYTGSANNAQEQAALADLIPVTPDDTLTVVFVRMTGANAYATVARRNPVPLSDGSTVSLNDRYFVFLNTGLNLNGDTLAHELHHVLFNRFDTNVPRQFYPFNTNPSSSFGITLPDARIRRRIQNLHTPDPNNDPNNNNIINWMKRSRSSRFPIGGGNSAATNTTGNTLVEDYS